MISLEAWGSKRRRSSARLVRRAGVAAVVVAIVLAPGCRKAVTDELRVGLSSSPGGLDPHLENTIGSIELLGNTYEPLVALDSEMGARPCLASSWATPDPSTWVFRLRPGVLFHDGTSLGVEDVVFSLTRPLLDRRLSIAAYLEGVIEVAGTGPETVVVKTRTPNALLLGNLSFVPIVPKGSTTGSLEKRPNGTGPWRIEEWTPGARLRFRRNPAYWGRRPAFERVFVDLAVSSAAARLGVLAGRWDVLRHAAKEVEALARERSGFEVVAYPNVFLRHLAFDVARERTPFCPGVPNPFRKREVREAIHLALDRTAIARQADREAIPTSQLVPPAIFGFDPLSPPVGRDVPRARGLLAAAGFPEGFDVTLHRSGFGAAAEEVKAQLAAIGIRVTIAQLPSREFFGALHRRELSFWIVADGCVTGDALEILLASFRSPDPALGAGVDNYGGYSNPELDGTISEALSQIDPVRRLPLIRKGLRIALADLPWVPLYFSRETLMIRRSLAYRPRADGLLRLADIRRA